MVLVINKEKKPLMPTHNAKARRLLKQKKAKVVTIKPFTIQLLYETTGYTQPVVLSIDSGYLNVGYSAITEKKELIGGEVKLLNGMSERIYERAMYRRNRRQRLRYRKARFDNRGIPKGWLAPSVRHKLDSHIRFIGKLAKLLPVSKVIVEVAAFDIQKIKNPDIEGAAYQQGEQHGFENIREYVFHRDGHKCQNPKCKSKDVPLCVHHLRYRVNGATDRPDDLITLCVHCHTPENHKGFLKDWKPKLNNFKDATFMTAVRWMLVNKLKDSFRNVEHTYGHITKAHRIQQGLEKSHHNDAYCIAGGNLQQRAKPISLEQNRRNNRSLETFYDAKYIDTRTGKKVSGGELNCGRTKRNKKLRGENLRVYRGKKMSVGRRSIRKQRYFYQPKDLVKYDGKIYTVAGTQNKGAYVALKETKKVAKAALLTPYKFRKGFA